MRALFPVLALAAWLPASANAQELLFDALPVPEVANVRSEIVDRAAEADWPFVPDRMIVFCVPEADGPQVHVTDGPRQDERVLTVAVGHGPRGDLMSSDAARTLLVPHRGVPARLRALDPFYRLGLDLCAAPRPRAARLRDL